MESIGTEPQTNGQKKMGFFDSVLAPPEWLNQSYVENVLRTYEKDDDLKLSACNIVPCTKPGDNFVGVIFRATVSFNSRGTMRNESYIVKIEPFLDGYKKDIMANQPFFKTEGRMYERVLPTMQNLLTNIGDPEIIAPNLIHFSSDPHNILIFQDIAPESFVMRHLPVPYGQAKEIAMKLGKFHALSYHMSQETNSCEELRSFQDGFFSEKLAANWDFIEANQIILAEVMSGWSDEMKLVAEKVDALRPHFLKKIVALFKPQENGINILNHGDHHIRNLMFRYDQNDSTKLDAIRAIDFQLSVYATPAIDLSYLLYMVADNDCREQHRGRLLFDYYNQFTTTLGGLGYMGRVPTLCEFQQEMLKNSLMEFFLATNFMNMFYMDCSQMADIDFSDKTAMQDLTRKMYEAPEYKKVIMGILPELMYRGALDL